MAKKDYIKTDPKKHGLGFSNHILRTIIVFSLFFAGIIAATQDFAYAMNGDYRIVYKPLFNLFGYDIYNPVFFILSFVRYFGYEKLMPYYWHAMFWFLGFVTAAFLVAVTWTILSAVILKGKGNQNGTARFASRSDLFKNGLLAVDGIMCGMTEDAIVTASKKKDGSLKLHQYKKGTYICHPGKQHTLIAAPPGSGKNVSIIIPSLLSYPHSVIVHDPKGENYKKTAGYRKTFSHVLKFAPCSRETVRFNFVQEIRDGDEFAFRDASLIANVLFTPANSKSATDGASEYFNAMAQDAVTAALLHIRFSNYEDKSLPGLLHLFSSTDIEEVCELMKSAEHYFTVTKQMYERNPAFYKSKNIQIGSKIEATDIHEKIVSGANRLKNTRAEERSTGIKTIFSKLQLFDDPVLAAATSASDFELEDFINSEKPISLYLVVPSSDTPRIAPVFRLLISFMMRKFTEGEAVFGEVQLKNDVNFILDEFPVLGRLDEVARTMAVSRGFGVFFTIVCQTIRQLEDVYGANHAFFDLCPVLLVFAPGNIKDAEIFSKFIGQESIETENISHSGMVDITSTKNINFSDRDSGRNLLDAADIKRIPGNRGLLFSHGMQPYIFKKIAYYNDKRFKLKVKLPFPSGLKEIISEAAGLPSVKALKKTIQDRKAKREKAVFNSERSAAEDFFCEDEENLSVRFKLRFLTEDEAEKKKNAGNSGGAHGSGVSGTNGSAGGAKGGGISSANPDYSDIPEEIPAFFMEQDGSFNLAEDLQNSGEKRAAVETSVNKEAQKTSVYSVGHTAEESF